jgi:hypothetical protein
MSLVIGKTRAPVGRKAWAMARMFDFSSVSGTSRSSVGMMVTFLQLSLAWASLA